VPNQYAVVLVTSARQALLRKRADINAYLPASGPFTVDFFGGVVPDPADRRRWEGGVWAWDPLLPAGLAQLHRLTGAISNGGYQHDDWCVLRVDADVSVDCGGATEANSIGTVYHSGSTHGPAGAGRGQRIICTSGDVMFIGDAEDALDYMDSNPL
jgi:hypothetical protein